MIHSTYLFMKFLKKVLSTSFLTEHSMASIAYRYFLYYVLHIVIYGAYRNKSHKCCCINRRTCFTLHKLPECEVQLRL